MPRSTDATRAASDRQPLAVPATPFVIGRYEARRLVAEHGQGLLYEGFDPDLGRTVAIKIVVSRGPRDDGPERCEREARALGQLQHPNIVSVFDFGRAELGGRPARYFVMEYLRGARTITDYAHEHSLASHERIRLFITFCDAVGAGHAAGILHRDLKPANLLVDRHGSPRVIDFGLASGHAVDASDSLRSLEQGSVLGTVWYMSPQHFDGDPDLIDQRADVYAMGVVLYELLTGVLPYGVKDASIVEAAEIIRHEPPAPARRADPRLRGDLEAILLRVLEKDPLRRYQRLADVSRDLRRWLEAEPVPAGRGGARLGGAVRRAVFVAPRGALLGCWAVATAAALFLVRGAIDTPGASDRWLAGVARAARAMAVGPGPSFETVRAVLITDDTDIAALSASLGLEGIDPNNPWTYRALYGRILGRLATARPKVIAIDVAFTERDDPGDAELVTGIRTVQAGGCEVVVASSMWMPTPGDPPPLDDDVISIVRWGGITGEFKATKPWRSDMALQQPGQDRAEASLALACLAAFQRPGSEYSVTISPGDATVRLDFFKPAGGGGVRSAGSLEAPASFVRRDRGSAEVGVATGSLIAYSLLDVPADEAFQAVSYDAGTLFAMTPAQINEAFHGRIVVIAKPRGGGDIKFHPDGRVLDGHQAQMVAIETLIDHRSLRFTTGPQDMVLVGSGALLGLAGAMPPLARPRRRWALHAAAGAGIMALSLGAFTQTLVLAHPAPVIAAVVLAGECSAAVAGVRRIRGVGLLERPQGVGV